MKRVYIISCFDEYKSRNKFVEEFFVKKGYEVRTFISDFHHQKKQYIQNVPRKNVELIHTTAYSKNLSFARIRNHYVFAKNIEKIVKKEKPDIVYANIPPNFVAWYLGKCRKNNLITNLVFDVYDMWPETMTFGKSSIILKLPFSLWRMVRNKHINAADINITACKLHEDILKTQGIKKLHTIHLLKDRNMPNDRIPQSYDMSEVKLCYLGTVNNIIDIETICKVIKELEKEKKVNLVFIGSGESKDIFLEKVKQAGATVIDYGMIYDDFEKEKLLLTCHFGLNIMKPQVCVGVTLKSLEYFSCGLPVINSIPRDTENFVNEYQAGFNVSNGIGNIGKMINDITSEKLYQMKTNTLKMFKENFSVEHFYSEFNSLIQL